MERPDFIEPLRQTQSANPARSPRDPFVRKSSPRVAPTLMLINGSGEASSLPSPIVRNESDDESFSSDEETPVLDNHGGHSKSLSVPGLFVSEGKSRTRDYSPSMSHNKPPLSPAKRNLSPPKMMIPTDRKPRPNHRRGHHHKHSLSHQLFLPPPERPPLPLPTHVPIPTFSEILSHSKITLYNILPLLAHTSAIIYLIHTSTGEASLVALTFLALNDLIAAIVQLISQTMAGFDVWRTETLRFPFGLQRVESLAEFGLGVLGTFNGLYVLKETIEDIIISFSTEEVLIEGTTGGHHHHHHYIEADPHRISPGGIDLAVLLLFLSTVYLTTTLSPHARTSKLVGLRVDYLTFLSCIIIFMIPLLGIPPIHSVDRSISLIIAFSMVALGLRTGKLWASILLCMPSKDEKTLIKQISSAIGVMGVEKHRMFQSTHRSGVAMFTIRISGSEEVEVTIREHIGRCITDWDKQIKWEYYVEFHR